MSKTRVQVQFQTLSNLVGGDVGQGFSAEETTYVDGIYDSVIAELNTDGVIYVADQDALDDAIFLPMCELIADRAATAFGGKQDEPTAQRLRNRIRTIVRPTPGYGPQIVEWF